MVALTLGLIYMHIITCILHIHLDTYLYTSGVCTGATRVGLIGNLGVAF